MDIRLTDNAGGFIIASERSGPSSVPYVHGQQDQAFQEAERLARLHGGKFYVLQVKGFAERADIRTIRYKDEDADIPF